jgi:hypothetical protein
MAGAQSVKDTGDGENQVMAGERNQQRDTGDGENQVMARTR